MQNSTLRAGLVAGMVAVGAGGCVNARDEFVDFGDRLIDASTADIDGAIVSEHPDVDGEFYMVARPNLSTDYFLEFRITVDYTPITANTGVYAYTGWCLDINTKEPVGEPITATDGMVEADGSFTAPLVGTFYGACNAIAPGVTVQANGQVHGDLVSADFLCGTMSGTAGALNLEGTTWASVRITGSTLPAPIHRCEDGPPSP